MSKPTFKGLGRSHWSTRITRKVGAQIFGGTLRTLLVASATLAGSSRSWAVQDQVKDRVRAGGGCFWGLSKSSRCSALVGNSCWFLLS